MTRAEKARQLRIDMITAEIDRLNGTIKRLYDVKTRPLPEPSRRKSDELSRQVDQLHCERLRLREVVDEDPNLLEIMRNRWHDELTDIVNEDLDVIDLNALTTVGPTLIALAMRRSMELTWEHMGDRRPVNDPPSVEYLLERMIEEIRRRFDDLGDHAVHR